MEWTFFFSLSHRVGTLSPWLSPSCSFTVLVQVVNTIALQDASFITPHGASLEPKIFQVLFALPRCMHSLLTRVWVLLARLRCKHFHLLFVGVASTGPKVWTLLGRPLGRCTLSSPTMQTLPYKHSLLALGVSSSFACPYVQTLASRDILKISFLILFFFKSQIILLAKFLARALLLVCKNSTPTTSS